MGNSFSTTFVAVANTGNPIAVKNKTENLRLSYDIKVWPLHCRAQVRVSSAPTASSTLSYLDLRATILLGTVVVSDSWNAGALGCLEEALSKRVWRAGIFNSQRTTGRVILRLPTRVVLCLEEVREDIAPAPAVSALLLPHVVVEWTSADVEHRVHRA